MISFYSRNKLLKEKEHFLPWQQDAFDSFVTKMTDIHHPFPCIPAQSGFSSNHFQYCFIGDPREENSYQELAELLKIYSIQSRHIGNYTSLVVFVETPADLMEKASVAEYEKIYWSLLNEVSALDEKDWPDHIPTNPLENTWEFCFHNESYFVYCATPVHRNRKSRYFPCMMLAFTPRWVLQKIMSSQKRSETLKKSIRKRLTTYDTAPIHPSLKWYGQEGNHEWQQYFLRDDETIPSVCPFSKIKKSLLSNQS